jgi:hypothetical protein
MRSKVKAAAGAVFALLVLVLAFGLPYSFVSEYGGLGLSLAPAVLVAAPLVALGLWPILRRGRWAVTGGVVLSVAAAVTGGALGQATYEGALQARASACSADERSEFEALGAVRTNGDYGTGDSDGSCHAPFGGRTQSSLDELHQVIEGRGWKPVGAETYERDGKSLRIEVTDEGGKGLDISLRSP